MKLFKNAGAFMGWSFTGWTAKAMTRAFWKLGISSELGMLADGSLCTGTLDASWISGELWVTDVVMSWLSGASRPSRSVHLEEDR
jgi:hypothetical protein